MPCVCCSAVDIRGRCHPDRSGQINQDNWKNCPMREDTLLKLSMSVSGNNTLSLWKEYNREFIELRKRDENNEKEYAHIKQDEIYRKFILDTVNGNFKTDAEYRAMALLIKINVVAYDVPGHWWYA